MTAQAWFDMFHVRERAPWEALSDGVLYLSDGHALVAISGAGIPEGTCRVLGPERVAAVLGWFAGPPSAEVSSVALLAWCDVPVEPPPCTECEGTGKVTCTTCDGTGDCDGCCGACGFEATHDCEKCEGNGTHECSDCDGIRHIWSILPGRIDGFWFDRRRLASMLRLVQAELVELGVNAGDCPMLIMKWPGHRALLMGLRAQQEGPTWSTAPPRPCGCSRS